MLVPIVSVRAYEILSVLEDASLSTSEIREAIGKDPHPPLGRLVGRGCVQRSGLHAWELSELGIALLRVGRLERLGT